MNKNTKLLSSSQISQLTNALPYQKTDEMKHSCELLQLPISGTKGDMIARILHFVATGTLLSTKTLPPHVKAQRGVIYDIAPDAPMLHGAYKCDARTRAFFKKLIGPHFAFTCAGQDWLKENWRKGEIPTYQEFADFWMNERATRKKTKGTPKQEWAYLHFIKEYVPAHPNCTHQEVSEVWARLRLEKALQATELIKKAAGNL